MTAATAGKLAPFAGQKYLSMETFDADGKGVATPLGFVEDAGALYVGTPEQSGKVARVRQTPRVRVVPCDTLGQPRGEWLEAEARVLAAGDPAAARANALLRRKFGLLRQLIAWWRRRDRGAGAIIEIVVR